MAGDEQTILQSRLHGVCLGFVREVVGWPRVARIALTLFLTLAVTFATLPLLTTLFRLVGFFTNNIDIVMAYTFTTGRGQLNALAFVSLLVGVVYYVIGWRVYVGMAGLRPTVRMRVFWFIVFGLAAAVLTGLWLLRGLTVGSGTA
jgi:hypothetical protein